MSLIVPPKRFVSLHSHTGFSTYDGLGYPSEHIDFVLENGMDSWTITDHGNANGHAHAKKHFDKIKKSGQQYRQLYGVEFYFVPSLKQWAIDRQSAKDAKDAAKAAALAGEEEEDAGHVIEDEDETRQIDVAADEWKRRYHLVVVAKNRTGLHNIYAMVKKSFKHGFYRFPRIDFEMLKEHGEGIVVSTACLGGIYSNNILRGVALQKSDQEIFANLSNLTDRFTDAVGDENFFLEIQFNKLEPQHVVNRYLIKHAQDTGLNLVATADSHYPRPDLWEARELYRALGWKGKDAKLPEKDELKCELYPKNASQMWAEYLDHRDKYDFYEGTEQIVKDAIEKTHDIAWQMCDDVWIDTGAKLPDFSRPDNTAFEQLVDLVKAGLRKEGLAKKKEYVERAKFELSDIKHLGFENYFLVMYEVFNKAADKTLFGCGRGCFTPDMQVKLADNTIKNISDVVKDDIVIDAYGNAQVVEGTYTYDVNEEIIELVLDTGVTIRCTKDHEILTERGWISASELTEDDNIVEV